MAMQVGALRQFLRRRESPAGVFLIHRTTGIPAAGILESGLRTEIRHYLGLDSISTIHSKLADDFRAALSRTHYNSTHHFVLLVPERALRAVAEAAKSRGITLPENKRPDAVAEALGGTLPREWIAGHFRVPSGNFIQNPVFDPFHLPPFSKLEALDERFGLQPRNATPGKVPVPEAAAAKRGSSGPEVW